MPTFEYKATSPARGLMSGTIAADTPRHARDLLRERGLAVDDLREAREGTWWSRWRGTSRPLSSTTSTAISRELATLLGVGITITNALQTLSAQHRGATQRALLSMHQKILAGCSVSEAIEQTPELFDRLDASLVRMGEASGRLDHALAEIAEFKENANRFRDKVGTALMYPGIVLTMALGITLFLMTSVVPSLINSLVEANRELPMSTKLVKSASDLLLNYWWALLLALGAAIAIISVLLRIPSGKRVLDRTILRLPVIGSLLIKQGVARIAFIVATLVRAGVGLIDAFELASFSTRNIAIRETLDRCKQSLNEGREMAPTLTADRIFPPMAVQILSVGQESGRLEEMLFRLAHDYTRQVNTASERLTAALDPIIIVVLAAVIGFIAFATILPIMEMGNVL
ncbi:type II secretion system F family protein [bacterium]|nr:type II secretion system F family protein [bacterium]